MRIEVPLTPAVLAAPILVVGAPRSGTTWLAKIIDSHPDVVYRHEPDKLLPAPVPLLPAAAPALISRWAANRSAAAVTKRPFFAKSWQSPGNRLIRDGLVLLLAAAARVPPLAAWAKRARVPDLARGAGNGAGSGAPGRVLLKSIALGAGAGAVARALPEARVVMILRHPCGQVDSMLRGHRRRHFDLRTQGTDMPFDEDAAIAHAGRDGLDATAFHALPDAAKFAWNWRASTETAAAALHGLPNAQVVLYEALCTQPVDLARRILGFTGLGWPPATQDFLTRSSTHRGAAGYYAVYRDAAAAAEAWRTRMEPADIAAVRAVMRGSPLASLWPDLAAAGRTDGI